MAESTETLTERLLAIEAYADGLMILNEGETEKDLRGYARGVHFTAKTFQAQIRQLRYRLNGFKDEEGKNL